jgi:hypothetical protein
MARTLIYTHKAFESHPGKYLKVTQYCVNKFQMVPGDHGKLEWWGMLEAKPGRPETGPKHHGLYRMTEAGFDFVYGRTTVPSHAIEYLSKVRKFDGSQISIVEALGKDFDYHELMRGGG